MIEFIDNQISYYMFFTGIILQFFHGKQCNVEPDLDTSCSTLMAILKEFFEKVNF